MTAAIADTESHEVSWEVRHARPAPQHADRALNIAMARISFLLGGGGAMVQRSTFGGMLERAELYSYGNDCRIPERAWKLPPKGADTMVIKHQKGEPGYDLDFDVLARLGSANRLLDSVERVHRNLRRALETYLGDCGERWARDIEKDSSGGVGHRLVALYPMTPAGKRWVIRIRAKFPMSEHLRSDEILASEYILQKTSPTSDRRKRIDECEAEAKTLLDKSLDALRDAALDSGLDAKAIRRVNLRSVS